ncbi:MAG: ATP synthase F1 subunit delta [Nitrospiria bacterium]
MPNPNKELHSVIESYAQALLLIAKSEGCIDQVEKELTDLRDALSRSSDLVPFLKDPKVTSEGKSKAVGDLLGNDVSRITYLQLGLAVEQGWGALLPGIIDHFFKLTSESRKKITARVITAAPISETAAEKIENTLSDLAGEPVFLKMSVDPKILGGITVYLGDRIIDGSLKNQIDRMREGISAKILTQKGNAFED